MVVMSERNFVTHTDSIHLQDLEFEKKLKTLIQKLKVIYHTPDPILTKLSLIISRNQHTSTPTLSITRNLNQLFVYDTRPINFIANELNGLFPQAQNGQGNFMNSNMQSTSIAFGDPELSTTLTTTENEKGTLDYGVISNHNGTNSNEIGYGTSENNMTSMDAISSSSSNNDHGSDYITNDNFIDNIPESNARGAIISDTRSAPLRRRPTTNMTLESESLQEILYHEDHNLANDIHQHIGQHSTFQSFLELLNMYDTHIIDHVELLQRLVPFLGRNKSLYERFKRNLMHDRMDNNENLDEEPMNNHTVSSPTSPFDPSIGIIMNDTDAASDISATSTGTLTPFHLAASRTKTNSPSYRWIPKALRNENCPGRDATCWEVLNDEYVSHPTWASEDNGFLSSSKSKSEEMLHMVEDERYALDIDICILSDVLSIMDKYLTQIMDMPRSQQSKMTLYPEKDGCSTALYIQAIKKVYPRERRKDAAKKLHNSPSEMLPGFLKLMKHRQLDLEKQKHDKVQYWKDTVTKHYYRFLDYHYESNKPDARKIISVPNMVNEIDALWHEQQRLCVLDQLRKQSNLQLQAPTSTTPISSKSPSKPTLLPPQFVYSFDDSSVITDVITLLRVSCHHQFQYNSKITKSIELFLSQYLPFFMGLPSNYGLDKLDEPVSVSSTAASGGLVAVKTRSHGHQRRYLVGSQRYSKKLVTLERRVFIGNTIWFAMARYFHMIYASLAHIKSIDQQYQQSPKETKRKMSARLDLTLESKAIATVTVDLTQGYYSAALEIIKALMRGDFEQIDFEEAVRYIFGVQAHVSFNIGKTAPCLIRQVHQIVTSSTLDSLYNTFKKYQPCQLEDMHSVLSYRYELDSILEPGDSRFIVAIDESKQQLTLQILGKHEAVLPKRIRDYIDYVTSYQQRKRKTVGVRRKSMAKVFLNRNLENEETRAPSKIFLQPNIRYEIDPQSYRMLFIEETEDVYVRQIINSKKRKFDNLDRDDSVDSL